MATVDDFDFKDLKALIRVDFNVPLDGEFQVTDTNRIEAAKPTIIKILEDGGSCIPRASRTRCRWPAKSGRCTRRPAAASDPIRARGMAGARVTEPLLVGCVRGAVGVRSIGHPGLALRTSACVGRARQ